MKRSRINYWSNSRLAEFIRGNEKPLALEFDEWEEWESSQKAEKPIRFWISDTLLNRLQDIVHFPGDVYDSMSCYLRNRFIDKPHYLPTHLKPGYYYECDDRILYGLFGLLVDFVEVELASWNRKELGGPARSRERGLKRLAWEKGLTLGGDGFLDQDDPDYSKPTSQAESATEQETLYLWWKDVRPKRQDPFDLVDVEKRDDKTNQYSYNEVYGDMEALKKQHEDEDTDMMVRLIKLRGTLWT